ncbi:MAG: low molecular weight phosphatase family protein [Olsenella sp.]
MSVAKCGAAAAHVRLPRVAFVCVHNACRSQMAEAVAHVRYRGMFEAFSAGTDVGGALDPLAVELVFERFGYDMLAHGLSSKPLGELPDVDVVVTMGCGVSCPTLVAGRREDWGLDDPMGGPREGYETCLDAIECKMAVLATSFGAPNS